MLKRLLTTVTVISCLTLTMQAAAAEDSGTVLTGGVAAPAPKHPFPEHEPYQSGTIKPNHVSQGQLDNDVRKKYDEWKARYLVQPPKESDQYYVYYNLEKEASPANAVSCSEGHGYGMLITSLMAGYDPLAKDYFDGLYRFFKAHPSVNNPALMAWQQIKTAQGEVIDTPPPTATTAAVRLQTVIWILPTPCCLRTSNGGATARLIIWGKPRPSFPPSWRKM
ncbi:glycosyl hydrolase family 8 [Paenibacillus sonchi]|uniref:glycosyl hydrolase family 8 n=1 Tax=Paenibacillus sonchi TaxID=373687 RepID=UPI0022789335|nr:glycosyl hydrolase family 8 [Paenibacillus sonchi]